ncbi:surface-anchored protein domain protein [Corynebacterium pyruviciproducens ATCC BAA-1742]|uniref:Surface-anchored protein domain protein n=1 Tax=Corynebacterium pyruviciproducens ATCC BAA-1742 TaxID=1125779 RepID=S2ZWF5_9CORY|nr:choice-of-anchor M domain-containing protein [Corynebacterium pyruviciproducens]EPD68374.1 surface-anchored protein domain protein [Corynebacterium pyruviciproducens ATCC BAA-1742]
MLRHLAATVLTLLAVVFSCTPATALTLTDGHIDAFYVTSDMQLMLENDDGLHQPEDVTLSIPASAYREETAQFLGVGAYFLPQAQSQGLIWPGWDTTESGTPLRLVFHEVSGPGTVYLFSQGTFGGVDPLLAGGALELASGSEINQDHPAHVHANWAFTEAGTYRMTVQAVAADGRESREATYTWQVGDGNSSATSESHAPTNVAAPATMATPTAEQHTTTSTSPVASNASQSTPSTAPKALASTGPTQLTGPLALLGLGLTVLGCGVLTSVRRP